MAEEKRSSRWQAYLSGIRGKLFRRRKVLMAVIWVARLIWRVFKLLLGDDPWTFYLYRMEPNSAKRGT